MLGGADNPNGELLSYIIGADILKGVDLDPVIRTTIGEIDVDKIPLTDIVKNRKQASLLVDKVGFDQ
ncbi:hypothetical protein HMPREF9346_05407 [Escherichia coli MS 119-7]|nr:hypothetical protein HMPREF9346_05407 [Escherichia coli MS 119-7]